MADTPAWLCWPRKVLINFKRAWRVLVRRTTLTKECCTGSVCITALSSQGCRQCRPFREAWSCASFSFRLASIARGQRVCPHSEYGATARGTVLGSDGAGLSRRCRESGSSFISRVGMYGAIEPARRAVKGTTRGDMSGGERTPVRLFARYHVYSYVCEFFGVFQLFSSHEPFSAKRPSTPAREARLDIFGLGPGAIRAVWSAWRALKYFFRREWIRRFSLISVREASFCAFVPVKRRQCFSLSRSHSPDVYQVDNRQQAKRYDVAAYKHHRACVTHPSVLYCGGWLCSS